MSLPDVSDAGGVDGDAHALHVTVTTGDTATRCTIYTSDAGDGHRPARWLTAWGDAFVNLDEMR